MEKTLFQETSDKCDIVLSQLMKAKKEIGSVKKDSKNPFHKSNYASLNAFIDASESHLMDNGLILIQSGNGSFTEPLIVSTLFHPASSQWIKSYMPILNPKSDSQGLGASVTYMRRYSMATLLGLMSEDDDGETAMGRGKYQQKAKDNSSKTTEEPAENEGEWFNKFMNFFDKDDKFMAVEWLKVIQKHFEWTKLEAIKEILKDDKKLLEKFNSWKNKVKKAGA